MEAPQTRTSVPQPAPNELPTLDLLHEGIIAKGVAIRVENGQKYSRSDPFCFLFFVRPFPYLWDLISVFTEVEMRFLRFREISFLHEIDLYLFRFSSHF